MTDSSHRSAPSASLTEPEWDELSRILTALSAGKLPSTPSAIITAHVGELSAVVKEVLTVAAEADDYPARAFATVWARRLGGSARKQIAKEKDVVSLYRKRPDARTEVEDNADAVQRWVYRILGSISGNYAWARSAALDVVGPALQFALTTRGWLEERLLTDAPSVERAVEALIPDEEYRRRVTYSADNELQAALLPRLGRILHAHRQHERRLLIVAPPAAGKTTVARLAALHTVLARQRVIFALPTKALVAQELATWQEMLRGTSFTVVAGSRDYPEYDRALAIGQFNVAVVVYEKLVGVMAGHADPLAGVGLVVIDELQNLATERRAPLEEMIAAVIRRRPDVAMLLLSAALDSTSRQRVCDWLSIPEENAITSARRPVDITTNVCDGRVRLFGPDPRNRTMTDVGLAEEAFVLPQANNQRGAQRSRAQDEQITAIVGRHVAGAQSPQHVLVFVPSRNDAERVAKALRSSADGWWGRLSASAYIDPNPYRTARFESVRSRAAPRTDLAGIEFQEGRRGDDPQWRRVHDGLVAGVAFHHGGLSPYLRRVIESEFNAGLLRIVVATDTLAEGVNTPADVVITTVTRFGPNRAFLPIDTGRFANRIGRACRPGMSSATKGDAWVLTATDDRIIERLPAAATVHGVWDYYVAPEDPGAHIPEAALAGRNSGADRGPLKERSDVVYHLAMIRGTTQPVELWLAELQSIFPTLLIDPEACEISPEDVFIEMNRRGAVMLTPPVSVPADKADALAGTDATEATDESRSVDERLNYDRPYAPTSVGRACALASLSLATLRTVADIHRLATTPGVRDRDLLAEACWDDEAVRKRLQYLQLPTGAHLTAQVNKRILDAVDEVASQWEPDAVEWYRGLVGGTRGKPFRRREVGLRTLILDAWTNDVPVAAIAARVAAVDIGDGVGPPTRVMDVTSTYIEALGDLVGYVVSAAADVRSARDVVHIDDEGRGQQRAASRRLQSLATRVRTGLPRRLRPLVQLGVPGLHRERLLTEATSRASEATLSLTDVIDSLETLSEQTRVRAKSRLEMLRGIVEFFPPQLASWAFGIPVPALETGHTYGEFFGEVLAAADPAELVQVLLGPGHGFDTTALAGSSFRITDELGVSVTIDVRRSADAAWATQTVKGGSVGIAVEALPLEVTALDCLGDGVVLAATALFEALARRCKEGPRSPSELRTALTATPGIFDSDPMPE